MKELKNILKEIDNTKINLKNLDKKLHKKVEELKNNVVTKQDLITIGNYLYWNVFEMKVQFIATKIFNISPHKLLNIIQPIKTLLVCKKCKQPLICLSRAEYNKIINKTHDYICNKCIEENNKNDFEQWKNDEIKHQQDIQHLKYMPYLDYLKTKHWQHIRERALRWANYKCSICFSKNNLHVHHKTYKNKGQELCKDVVVLCKNCHELYHNKLQGTNND